MFFGESSCYPVNMCSGAELTLVIWLCRKCGRIQSLTWEGKSLPGVQAQNSWSPLEKMYFLQHPGLLNREKEIKIKNWYQMYNLRNIFRE